MIKIKNSKDCCGCEACVQICPKGCISLRQDRQGFYYPQADATLCVECGACTKVCPIINVDTKYRLPADTAAFAAYNTDALQRMTSSSGGLFVLLSEQVIKSHGVVFGASFDDAWNVRHTYAETLGDIAPLKRSKYVQSRIGDTFKQARQFLRQGRCVLFVGTSCQIAGLRRFLRRDYDNLITIDVVCHGVPSPMIWQKYLAEKKRKLADDMHLEDADSVRFTDISFRHKKGSWRRFRLHLSYHVNVTGIDAIAADSGSGQVSTCVWEDDYMLSFLKDYANRPSCFACRFRDGLSHSDITLADFWGIENLTSDAGLAGDSGTSLVMVHTSKGRALFDSVDCMKTEFPVMEALRANPAAFYNWPKPVSHDLFFRECEMRPIREALRRAEAVQAKYGKYYKLYQRVMNKIRRIWQK